MLPSRPARSCAVALLVALLGALLPAGAAQAASRTVQGGRLDWGIKSSFQSYVTGPIANGSWSLNGGAATVGGSQFRFHSAKGSYDPDSGAFQSGFSGGVRFVGHRKADGTNELDLTISRPTVKISGSSGTLYADVSSKAKATGKVTSSSQVPLAALQLSGINMKGGTSPIRLSTVPATLTSQGAQAFAGYYAAGTPLDPVSLGVDIAGGADKASTGPSTEPSEGGKKGGKKGDKKDERKPQTVGAFQDAAVDWGVRRTFREYVTGSISQGKWTLSGGAQDGGALFRFPQGTGSYDGKKQTLDADFAGSVRFTGAHLDLTLTKVATRVKAGKGALIADVVSDGRTVEAVPLITFEAKDFAPRNGLAVLTEAPATLTEGGAKAFGGMYRAGTAMDPVSLAVAVDKKAQLPALPDLGSDATPPAQPEQKAGTTSAPAPGASSSSSRTGTYISAGAGVLAAAAIALYAVRRRRTTQN
ncbi:HtaA domain-containing protein [Streptomyces sp. NBC_01142]|uniref:HtaA domain-containing protein n=1 Tax=Streptomyces sp. NBC_01142 TaxID=2975865 RepID=UPI0022553D0F|nr:HtaA domain-containing protein [Streptomyces sp. NBC_01142]MCX4822678.1 HtaA domain-containing protein [Streptomyces sp. NBC_01142]